MIGLAALALAAAASATPAASPAGSVSGRTWKDAAAYCRAVGTVDRPDRRYVGPKDAPWMRNPWAADGDTTGPDGAPMPIAWRCMDGAVKVCAFGANVPCDSKANQSRRNPGADAWCRENPGSRDIPMAATGHDSIYDWSCHGRRAVAGRVELPVDRRGYQKFFWKTARP